MGRFEGDCWKEDGEGWIRSDLRNKRKGCNSLDLVENQSLCDFWTVRDHDSSVNQEEGEDDAVWEHSNNARKHRNDREP